MPSSMFTSHLPPHILPLLRVFAVGSSDQLQRTRSNTRSLVLRSATEQECETLVGTSNVQNPKISPNHDVLDVERSQSRGLVDALGWGVTNKKIHGVAPSEVPYSSLSSVTNSHETVIQSSCISNAHSGTILQWSLASVSQLLMSARSWTLLLVLAAFSWSSESFRGSDCTKLEAMDVEKSFLSCDLASSSHADSTASESNSTRARLSDDKTAVPSSQLPVYDFVVIGYGHAGQSAVETLKRLCPKATIAIIDPWRIGPPDLGREDTNRQPRQRTLAPMKGVVEQMDPIRRSVQVALPPIPIYDGQNQAKANRLTIQYQHAALIATGARGAPPPHYLIDKDARQHMFMLKPHRPEWMDGVVPAKCQEQHAGTVRQRVVQLALDGTSIGILGSGWDAVDLAAAVVTSRRANHRHSKSPPCTLVFGASGPLSHVLPNYLSAAVAKRLRARHVNIMDRTLVRFISRPQPMETVSSLQLYTAKSYDLMDSQRTSLDVVVIAPETSGPRGSAVQATTWIPSIMEQSPRTWTHDEESNQSWDQMDYMHAVPDKQRRWWYQTWGSLATSKRASESSSSATQRSAWCRLISCFNEDGRIVVNPELMACSGVFAAGSVAKVPNSLTGHAVVAGGGVYEGTGAGHVAAVNMAQQYHTAHRRQKAADGVRGVLNNAFWGADNLNASSSNSSRLDDDNWEPSLKDVISIWRSDLRSVHKPLNGLAENSNCKKSRAQIEVTSLSDVGIRALCVGNCDSQTLMTHGVWWSNLGGYNRQLRQELSLSESKDMTNPSVHQRRRRRTTKIQGLSRQCPQNPVYGLGVVYYFDRTGRIQGIMTWGLPFTTSHYKLNGALIEFMKGILLSNGDLTPSNGSTAVPPTSSLPKEKDQLRFSAFLADASRIMLATAFAGYIGYDQNQLSGNNNADEDDSDDDNDVNNHGMKGMAITSSFVDTKASLQLQHNDSAVLSFAQRNPLHRYTEIRPANVRSLGVLKRKDGNAHGILGEDLFDRYEYMDNNGGCVSTNSTIATMLTLSKYQTQQENASNTDAIEMASRKAPYGTPIAVGYAAAAAEQMHAWNRWIEWDRIESAWDENEDRARPPKEDCLWIRKGDDNRSTTGREATMAAYNQAIWVARR